MKIMQIIGSICHWDATAVVGTLEATKSMFSSELIFVEAPDYVFEGWGFDESKEGDERFLRPVPVNEYMEYDEMTGTFYEKGCPKPYELNPVRLYEENARLKTQLKAATDRADFIEDCIAEMAMMVYSE